MFNTTEHFKLLQNLLNPEGSSESEDDYPPAKPNYKPSDIRPLQEAYKKETEEKIEKAKSETVKKIDNIEEWLENQEVVDADLLEKRKRPSYSVVYKQAVKTEDIYLQMGNKNAATMSCEDMVIQVEMPEETVSVEEMDLSVTETEIDLKSPVYRLKIPLAHRIDPDKGKAAFDSERKILTLTLRLTRELDFINF